jgi:hypothetical protein
MSIDFTPTKGGNEILAGIAPVGTCCLCAQLAPVWTLYAEGVDAEALRAAADPACNICGGTGVEAGLPDFLRYNLCNANAFALLGLLRLGSEYCGSISIAEARRAIMVAKATFETTGELHARAATVDTGAPREREDGTTELRPARMISSGLNVVELRFRLIAFESLVNLGADAGADSIEWG